MGAVHSSREHPEGRRPRPPPQSPPPSAPRPSPGGDRAGSAGGPTGAASEGCGEGGDAGLRPWPPACAAPAAGRPAQAAAALPTACSGLHCSGLGAAPARSVMHMHERRGGSIVLSERAAARWRGLRLPLGGGRRAGQAERMKRREPRSAAARGRAGSHGGERADRQVGGGAQVRRCARAAAARDVVPGPRPVRAATLTWAFVVLSGSRPSA
ncbi:Amiloride-Sensitive Sodium Channel Subunit Alpha [Manis pentadactyla]|nr:Amiloride-Sensitive Sodium Channel Subunit Alpha [Manis pentadactyla]